MPKESPATASLLSTAIELHKAGDHAGAQSQYLIILAQAPDHAEVLYLSGAIDYQQAAYGKGAEKLERSLRARPGYLPAIEMLGAASARISDFTRAAQCFGMAALQNPKAPELHYNHGYALFKLGSHGAAAAACRKALALKTNYAQALYILAAALRLDGQLAAAAVIYAQVTEGQPENINALDEYGGVLFELGQTADAEAILRRTIAAAPDAANPYTNLGRIYQTNPARAREALELHEQAIVRDPNSADAQNNRGAALYGLGRFDEAIGSFQRAIAAKPTLAEAHHNLALTLLTTGNMYAGWIAYEWRWKCRGLKNQPRNFTQDTWTGENLAGKQLLIWGEQGVGDELLQGTMAADLAEGGAPLIWETDARLVPLIKRSYPHVRVIACTTPADPVTKDPTIGAQISAAGLGRYLRPKAETFPKRRAYLKADPARVAGYRERLLAPDKNRVIGVSWISTHPDVGKYKSSALSAWAPIWQAGGSSAQFVDLQYGESGPERRAANLDLLHMDDLDLFNDLDGLAALISACDVVITVSNTTAHMAGALGVPGCVMIPAGSAKLWYWGAGESTCLWYPSAKIFKQSAANDWTDVIERVADWIAEKL